MNEMKFEILLKKAQKFFEQFPDKTRGIFKIKVGKVDTHWNVQKNNKQLTITEINSSKNTFVVREDETVAGAKGGKKPFLYDPDKKMGNTGTVAPGMELQKYSQQKGSEPSIRKAASAIRSNPKMQNLYKQNPNSPPSLPSAQKSAELKMKSISQGKNHFDPEVIKKASQRLSDQEFGQFYGMPKKSLVKQATTPPPLPSRVKKTSMQPYDPRGELRTTTKTLTTGKNIPQTMYRVILSEDDIKGLDSSEEQPEVQEPIDGVSGPQKTSEEKAIEKLVGQTIKSADIEIDENGGNISLELAGMHQPAVLQWSKDGKIIFSFRGQKYIIKK